MVLQDVKLQVAARGRHVEAQLCRATWQVVDDLRVLQRPQVVARTQQQLPDSLIRGVVPKPSDETQATASVYTVLLKICSNKRRVCNTITS